MKYINNIIQNNREVLYFISFLVLVIVGTVVVHEIGHLIVALALGVPINEIKIHFIGINPGLKMPDGLSASSLTYIQYAGGVVAAAVLLAIFCIFI